MKEIEIGLYYDQYTIEELKLLPPLKTNTGSKKNWLWDGEDWDFVPRDD